MVLSSSLSSWVGPEGVASVDLSPLPPSGLSALSWALPGPSQALHGALGVSAVCTVIDGLLSKLLVFYMSIWRPLNLSRVGLQPGAQEKPGWFLNPVIFSVGFR